jgi:triphosphoribosyl-dephospho-CoA synthase
MTSLETGQLATLACLLEVNAPKPGNVHRSADFEDLQLADFLVSAMAIGPAMQDAPQMGVGQAVLAAVRATRELVQTNTNLGTVLLFAPLAVVPRNQPLADGIAEVLASLTSEDADAVYEAIRLAAPGGLGRAEKMDVSAKAPSDLLQAMKAASERDLVARQFANGFQEVLQCVVPELVEGRTAGWLLSESIVRTHVRMMAEFPDSLIARKCGDEVARESSDRAAQVLQAGGPGDADYLSALADLDFWLRSDHHRRNPGTTADLIAAGLFAALREELFTPPFS